VARAAGQGRGFFYALNAGCLANEEFSSEGQRWLVDRLGWLTDIGAQGVVLANPYLVAFAKARFPQLQVAVSTAACVDSVDKAEFYERRGADVLYLPEYVNRDFRLLRELRKPRPGPGPGPTARTSRGRRMGVAGLITAMSEVRHISLRRLFAPQCHRSLERTPSSSP
jgi:hypothetical protein